MGDGARMWTARLTVRLEDNASVATPLKCSKFTIDFRNLDWQLRGKGNNYSFGVYAAPLKIRARIETRFDRENV